MGINFVKALDSIFLKRRDYELISRLDLNKNCIRDEGCAVIAELLRNSRSLVHLGLASNEITFKGVEKICERGLCQNETLVSLDLSSIDGLSRNKLFLQGGLAISQVLERESSNI